MILIEYCMISTSFYQVYNFNCLVRGKSCCLHGFLDLAYVIIKCLDSGEEGNLFQIKWNAIVIQMNDFV